MDVSERVAQLVTPVVEANDLEIYDIELASGILRITVDRASGIDVDALGDVSKCISQILDDEDVISDTRYLLEVSSPGVERRLRLPRHFQKVVDSEIRVRLRSAVDGVRRFDGRLVEANDTAAVFELEGNALTFAYEDIEDARTIFDWDAEIKNAELRNRDSDADVDQASSEDNSSNKKASAQ